MSAGTEARLIHSTRDSSLAVSAAPPSLHSLVRDYGRAAGRHAVRVVCVFCSLRLARGGYQGRHLQYVAMLEWPARQNRRVAVLTQY